MFRRSTTFPDSHAAPDFAPASPPALTERAGSPFRPAETEIRSTGKDCVCYARYVTGGRPGRIAGRSNENGFDGPDALTDVMRRTLRLEFAVYVEENVGRVTADLMARRPSPAVSRPRPSVVALHSEQGDGFGQ